LEVPGNGFYVPLEDADGALPFFMAGRYSLAGAAMILHMKGNAKHLIIVLLVGHRVCMSD
jgi:hypothetical protein